jgi:hypothetical protein
MSFPFIPSWNTLSISSRFISSISHLDIKHHPMFCWIFLGTSLYIINSPEPIQVEWFAKCHGNNTRFRPRTSSSCYLWIYSSCSNRFVEVSRVIYLFIYLFIINLEFASSFISSFSIKGEHSWHFNKPVWAWWVYSQITAGASSGTKSRHVEKPTTLVIFKCVYYY